MKRLFIFNPKKIIFILTGLFLANSSFGQTASPFPKEYIEQIQKADTLYEAKDYKGSALCYTAAFIASKGKARQVDHYNAACSWALANVADSAFAHLEYITTKGMYADYDQTVKDADLTSLHEDKRWAPLLEMIKKNKPEAGK